MSVMTLVLILSNECSISYSNQQRCCGVGSKDVVVLAANMFNARDREGSRRRSRVYTNNPLSALLVILKEDTSSPLALWEQDS